MWNESDHPRNDDGTFKPKGKASKVSPFDPKTAPFYTSKVTKKEWRMWYDSIGEIKRGMWCPEIDEGHLIQVANKIFVTSGTYETPILEYIMEFANEEEADAFIERCEKW